MAKTLNDLNDILFETLAELKEGKVEPAKAQTIVNISNSIVNNAKIQLQAFRLTNGKTGMSLLSENKDPELMVIGKKDRGDVALEFAQKKGFKNIAEAMVSMGKHTFNTSVDKLMTNVEVH